MDTLDISGPLPSLLPIRKYGDPVLQTPAKPVTHINKDVQKLIPALLQTMYAEPGIGLAAPQVGVPLRLIVLDVAPEGKTRAMALINPVISARKGKIKSEEGCLSFPGIHITIRRSAWVQVSAVNPEGLPVTVEAEGLLSRCLQHEMDHLDGIVMIDHLSLPERLKVLWDIRQQKKTGRW